MTRPLLRIAGLSLAGLAAACLVAEAALRVVEATPLWRVLPASEVALYGPDPATGYRHRAGASGIWLKEGRSRVTISSLGLRDRERNLAHGAGPRALVVGDSVIEAVQVDLEDTAVRIAERKLAEHIPGVEVVNLGLAGANPPVMMARLQSAGLPLSPDVAVMVLTVGDFLSSGLRDDSGWTAYRPGPDGALALSYSFRDTRSYRLRTSIWGRALYAALDHSALARVLNSRKNIGLFAEWPRTNAATEAGPTCSARIERLRELWIDGAPADARAVLDAFLRDLSTLARARKLPVVVAFRGIPAPCAEAGPERAALVQSVARQLEGQGLRFVDVEAAMAARGGPDYVAKFHGFGASRGHGHLNVEGNRAMGDLLAGSIASALGR